MRVPEPVWQGRHFVRWKGFVVRAQKFLRLFFAIPLLLFSLTPALAQTAPADGAQVLPDKVSDFRALGASKSAPPELAGLTPEDFQIASSVERVYVWDVDGSALRVNVITTRSASAAYSLLRYLAGGYESLRQIKIEGLGSGGVWQKDRLSFVKGSTLVTIHREKGGDATSLGRLAKLFADATEGETENVPVLVLHLPDWEKKVDEELAYAVSLPALQKAAGNRPALDAFDFDEGTEAVTATYGDSRLVIVEFPTPQHSVDADTRINERIAQLKANGQPVPSSYKRVGNYSVFVFDAPDSAAAEKLVSQVKYEKDVRWLGRNPHAEEIAVRAYTSTMGGVILTTLITTGLAILLCLGVGGLIGGAVFLRRRSRQAAQEVYTDAGGMVRLNIEDLNTPPAATNLLGRGED